MGPKPAKSTDDDYLFRTELVNLIDQRHELFRLAELIDWQAFANEWSPQFVSTTGRPALPTRLMAALLYLKHVYALSDENAVERWSENPYWQHFSGERYFQHELPCDSSSLVRWPQRIGEAGCEWLLAQSIEAAKRGCVIKRASLDTVVLHTTVQPKAIARPTDSRLLNRAREQLVDAAPDAGFLRQSYARVGKAAEHQAGAARMPANPSACTARSGSCAPGWAASSATCSARAVRSPACSRPRSRSRSAWSSSAATPKTSCTRWTRRRWSASPRASPARRTSSA